jgi:hypothetical protein
VPYFLEKGSVRLYAELTLTACLLQSFNLLSKLHITVSYNSIMDALGMYAKAAKRKPTRDTPMVLVADNYDIQQVWAILLSFHSP